MHIVANLHFVWVWGPLKIPLCVIWRLSLDSINFRIALLFNVTLDFTIYTGASACFWCDFCLQFCKLYYWGINRLSAWFSEDLNLAGRGCGKRASAYAPTLADLINFWWSNKNRFYWTYKHNNRWMRVVRSCYIIEESSSQFGKPCSEPCLAFRLNLTT